MTALGASPAMRLDRTMLPPRSDVVVAACENCQNFVKGVDPTGPS